MRINLKHFIYVTFIIGSVLLLTSCNKASKGKEYLIGFSQCTMDDIWRVQMVREMEREVFLLEDIDMKIELKDAQNDIEQQKSDIRALIKREIDVLVVSPYRSEPLKQLIDSVAQLDIPVILIDRHIKSKESIFYIGASNYEIGKKAGNEIMRLLPDGGHILSFTGLEGSKPAEERKNGFLEIVKDNDEYVVSLVECDWTEKTAYGMMQELIKKNIPFDLIYTHNDFMARGAIKALQEAKIELPPIVGVDGLNAPDYGIDMVMNSTLTATFTYPTGGEVAIQTAYKIITEQKVDQHQELNSILINRGNVEMIKVQRDEIDRQIEKIDQQNVILADKEEEIVAQEKRLWGISFLLLGLLIIVFLTYFFRKKIKENDEVELAFEFTHPIPFLDGVKNEDKAFIAEIEAVIIDNLINQKMSIQFLADRFAMSHSTIYRKIKQITGLKGVELINLIKMQHAEKLIKTTNLPIKEIAFQTGFSTSSYFSTCFLKHFGISPAEFRKGNKIHDANAVHL